MQNPIVRLGVPAIAAALIGNPTLHGATYAGAAYEGFDYAAGNVPQPTAAPVSGGLSGGTGFGSGTGAMWGATYGQDNATVITGSNARFALNGNSTTVASANQQILSTGLSYSGLASSGGALQTTAIASPNTSASVGRHFGQVVDSGTFYFSYLVQKNADTMRTAGLSFFGTVGTTATAPNERMSIGQVGNNIDYYNASGVLTNAGPVTATVPTATGLGNQGDFQVAIQNSQAATSSIYKNSGVIERNATTNPGSVAAQPFALGSTYLVVGKIDFNVGGNGTDDRMTIYLNPTDLTNEGINPMYFSATGFDLGQLTGFRVFTGNNQTGTLNGSVPFTYTPASATWDEFRFGTSWSDVMVVVPEPASAALGGLGMLGLLIRRRRA